MLAKLKLLVIILTVCTLFIAGQQDPSTLSPSSPQEDALLYGVDVSHFQGEINWDQVKQNEPEISFVFVKASEGINFVDAHFVKNWTGAKQAGILRGAFHFFESDKDAKAQADLFINTVKTLEENDLPPLLDLESGKFDELDEVAHDNYINNVFTWLEEVEKALGVKPIIYASPDFARDYLTDKKFSGYAQVVAEYDTVSAAPKMWGAWEGKTWTFWQYSADHKVKGITDPVNLAKFNGSAQELFNFVKISRKEEIEVILTADESKEPPAVEEKKETPAKTVPEIPIDIEKKETPPETEPETPISKKEEEPPLLKTEPEPPTVETTSFTDEISLGNINFPRDFIHNQIDHKKGVYQVKLITKENEDIPYFQVYDKENQLLFEEMALVIPRKGKFGKFKHRIRKRILSNEYFMIRVTKPDKHIYAFFFIKK
jgi:lysozyme